jgi:hypothetical protein
MENQHQRATSGDSGSWQPPVVTGMNCERAHARSSNSDLRFFFLQKKKKNPFMEIKKGFPSQSKMFSV